LGKRRKRSPPSPASTRKNGKARHHHCGKRCAKKKELKERPLKKSRQKKRLGRCRMSTKNRHFYAYRKGTGTAKKENPGENWKGKGRNRTGPASGSKESLVASNRKRGTVWGGGNWKKKRPEKEKLHKRGFRTIRSKKNEGGWPVV